MDPLYPPPLPGSALNILALCYNKLVLKQVLINTPKISNGVEEQNMVPIRSIGTTLGSMFLYTYT